MQHVVQPLTPETAAPRKGWIALVGAGPGARDLLTFRAAARIYAADVIFYDRLIEPELLDLARPGAEKIFVGKEVGAHSWPQDRINAVITAAALAGRGVVRLKSGDPSVFGRACEELEAARALDLPVEIVPGVTAAAAAAAVLGRPLTERGATDRLVMATATCKPGDPAPDLAALLTPGATLALYMAVQRLEEIAAQMRAAGLPGNLIVEIVASAGKPGEQILRTRLDRMAWDARAARIKNPAIILIRHPKPAAEAAATAGTATAAAL
ncbi:uroporphyrinogen-III C-methyltransferase [Phaeovulum sp. W22_SRMD_FR3]|uniref:uroporphyrinogen-III C-methyltransferase n=1 Tax=Phaeovulum sp. W22_SRMD_FR3 TaxID=3240274 RepID=UPI003F9E27C3